MKQQPHQDFNPQRGHPHPAICSKIMLRLRIFFQSPYMFGEGLCRVKSVLSQCPASSVLVSFPIPSKRYPLVVDGSNTTGCFDLLCPGFVQTSNEIALGGVLRSIPVLVGLPEVITLHIVKDPSTANWWLRYQESINVGYWPSELFEALSGTAETVQWGGEVYSTRLGHPDHTSTGMGTGELPTFERVNSGWIKSMRIQDNSMFLKLPEWLYLYTDDFECYNGILYQAVKYVSDPEFYFGGPGLDWHSWRCLY